MAISKKIDWKKDLNFLIKKMKGHRQDNTKNKSDDIFVFVVPYIHKFGEFSSTNNFNISCTTSLARAYKLLGKSVSILPMPILDYVLLDENNKTQKPLANQKSIYQTISNFYDYSHFLGCFFDFGKDAFSDIDIANHISKIFGLNVSQKAIYNEYAVRYRSIANQSILTENDIYTQKKSDFIYFIKFFIEAKGFTITVPYNDCIMLMGTVAVIVHPKDKRYKKFIGKNLIVPIINRTIPIIGDESVNMEGNTGVLPIIPAHDSFGLEIAKKYDLPIDILAIDQNGLIQNCIDEFKGKKVEHFRENLNQYIADIGNLDNKIACEHTEYYEKNNKSKVIQIASKQRFFKGNDLIYPDIELKQYNPNKQNDKNIDVTQGRERCISSEAQGVSRVCAIQIENGIQAINIQDIIENFDFITFLVVYLFLNGYLDDTFSLDDIFFVLQYSYNEKVEILLEQILRFYQKHTKVSAETEKQIDIIQKILSENDVNKITELLEICEKNKNFITQKNKIQISRENILSKECSITKNSIGSNFLAVLYADYMMTKKSQNIAFFDGAKQNDDTNTQIFLINNPELENINKTIYRYFANKGAKVGINIINNETQQKNHQTSAYYNIYSPDANILAYGDSTFEPGQLEKYDFLIQKVRNASLRISKNIKSKKITTNIDEVLQKTEISDYIKRILFRFEEISNEFKSSIDSHNLAKPKNKLLYFVQYYVCEGLIEHIKTKNDEASQIIFFYIFVQSIQLLNVYMPFLCNKIRNLFKIEKDIYDMLKPISTANIQKNYKFMIMMDIVGKRRSRYHKYKPQNRKAYLYIKSDKNFFDFVNTYDDFVSKICKNSELIRVDKSTSIKDTVLDSAVFLDIHTAIEISNDEDKKTIDIDQIKKDIEEKRQMIEKIRSIIILIHPQEKALKKQYENHLEKLKEELNQLDYALSISKMK